MHFARNGQVLLAVITLLLAGCGGGASDPFARVPVSGTVKVDGEPVQFGTITLTGEKNTQTQETAQAILAIRNGEFSTKSGGLGTTAGKNEVVVTVYGSDPDTADPEGPAPEVVGHWKSETEVTANTPLDFDIPAGELQK